MKGGILCDLTRSSSWCCTRWRICGFNKRVQ